MGTHNKVAQVSKRMLEIYLFFCCALLSSTLLARNQQQNQQRILYANPYLLIPSCQKIDSRHPKRKDVIALNVLQEMLTNRSTVSKSSRLGVPHNTKYQGISTPGPCPCTSFLFIRNRMPQGIGSFLEPILMAFFFFFASLICTEFPAFHKAFDK